MCTDIQYLQTVKFKACGALRVFHRVFAGVL